MRHALRIILTLALATLATLAHAQATGSITGTVTNADNVPLPGVTVTITGPTLTTPRVAITDASGNFTVRQLPVGDYHVNASTEGFATTTITTTVQLASAASLHLTLGISTNEPPFTIVRVYYGTNRQRTTNTNTAYDYNGTHAPLTFGSATVSIPRDHRLADWEQPLPGFHAHQDQHVILLTVIPRAKNEFLTDLHHATNGKEAFVFVHGYNTSFADAIQRTALLAYDLEFNGTPITFTWPSRASLFRYPADEDAATASIQDLEDFLQLVADQSGATKIHLIAHSMGNRVMLEALHSLQQQHNAPSNLSNLILAAPDVNIIRFNQLLTNVKTLAHTTLYASDKDRALRASKRFHGYRRAGEAGPDLFLMHGIDTIDATSIDTGLIAHSYYADNKSVVTDLYDLITNASPPAQRSCLTAQQRNALPFWIFRTCPSN